jgi:hypothetical protein
MKDTHVWFHFYLDLSNLKGFLDPQAKWNIAIRDSKQPFKEICLPRHWYSYFAPLIII